MKRLGWILVLLLAAVPAWSAKKITVGELKDSLLSMHQDKKSDADVASALKQVQLTEELTRSVMNSLAEYLPGPQSTEQIYVLEARSAVLAPPPTDIPATAAPDAAAQKALLDKASDYVSKTYQQLPALTATKTTLRFQDNVEAVAASSGMHGSATDVSVGSSFVNAAQFVHYINSSEAHIESQSGAEKLPSGKDKTPWGANGQIALQGQGPVLSNVLQEAQSSGPITFLRWEMVNGKTAAVFSFEVPKKKSHYNVAYCCFPETDQTGVMNFSARSQAGGPQAHGNLQTNTDFTKTYKATVGYHGELFIDPDTGIVVRLITLGEFKNTDIVHQEDQRIDYGPVTVGGKMLVLPVKTIIDTEVAANGDTSAAKYASRVTLFTTEYKDYQAAGATAQK